MRTEAVQNRFLRLAEQASLRAQRKGGNNGKKGRINSMTERIPDYINKCCERFWTVDESPVREEALNYGAWTERDC
jgi:hypothetical protein